MWTMRNLRAKLDRLERGLIEDWLMHNHPIKPILSRSITSDPIETYMRQRDRGVIRYVTNRDLRRTFNTLAGKAGVPKEVAIGTTFLAELIEAGRGG
ncbi:hypothetical protein [Rhizobium leguminosarum]|uniref:hypothetical protein n=1 Tax=Rhizobium leguminosarum TaxID=384 RepID=UPI001C98DFD4|nr:hypothetical protein [Rhizobium leguminosarum]MBY5426989.1 hypothetical protein [Rhizobium leguminosarum]